MGTYADLETAVRRQIQYLTDGFVARSRADLALRFHRGDPKLPRTLFTRDCVARHRSFEAGGARYNWAVVSYQGIANLIDGLAAVRRCVFEERRVEPGELLAALRADFAGYEPLRQRLLAVPKFGNDESYVDEPGAGMVRFAWEQLLAHETPRGGRYLPACILFVTYYWAGQRVGATPDGRRSGEVLTDSVGPAQGRDVHGPTAMLNSVTRLPLHLAIGTPVLNIRFMPALMASQEARGKVAQLIRAFFAGGGLQIQVSVLDRAAMLEAQREPDRHRDLIVRVGGYSEYFANLNRELQDSIIARTEHGMG
jgi:formate C-acetyltransferase